MPTAPPSPTATPTTTPTPQRIMSPRLSFLSPQQGSSYRRGEVVSVTLQLEATVNVLSEALVTAQLQPPRGTAFPLSLTPSDGCHWVDQVGPLKEIGLYTLLAHLETPASAGTILEAQAETHFRVISPSRSWVWLLTGAGGLSLLAGGAVWWIGSHRPPLRGILRLAKAPSGEELGQYWDLTRLSGRRASIGQGDGCPIRLTGDPRMPRQAATLIPCVQEGEMVAVLRKMAREAEIRVNGQPLRGEHLLHDGDRIELGPYLLRYEDLAQRARRFHQGTPWRSKGDSR